MRLYELITRLIATAYVHIQILDHPTKIAFSGTVQELRYKGSWFYNPFSMAKIRNICIEQGTLCIYCEDN